MTGRACPRADEAARTAAMSDDLAGHVASCVDCRRARLVAGALGVTDPGAARAATRPSAGLLWWKSRLAREAALQDEALRPVAVAEVVAPPALLAALGAWLIVGADGWSTWLGPLVGDAAAAVLPVTAGIVALGAAALIGMRLGALMLRRPSTGVD